ncbi:MAG: ATP-grasp domain-containing protein [Candidatus ainarchaeum sp.]|nr:ATP-grasp domain-containing protein [Candidatus ainarchaeum sp.]
MRIAVLHRDERAKEKYPLDFEGRIEAEDTASIIRALAALGHEVLPVCASANAIFSLKKAKPDIVFNACDDGLESDSLLEPHVAAIIEAIRLPYTGNNYLALGLCMNKALAKQILLQKGILTPDYQLFETGSEKLSDLSFPLIVKPAHEDGSIGIKQDSVAENIDELRAKVKNIINNYKQAALVEEFIEGREFSVSMIGNEKIDAFQIAEIVFEESLEKKMRIYSYESKWLKESPHYKKVIDNCPADIDRKTGEKITQTAIKAFRALGCQGYGRVEFRLRDEELHVIEVNPNSDLSEDAELAKSAALSGISYKELIQRIVMLGLKRGKSKGGVQSEQVYCRPQSKARNNYSAKRIAVA